MPGDPKRVAELLHQAAETHHIVYADTDGDDADWATFYSDWLLRHSPLADELGSAPVRSHLTAELVALDREYRARTHDQSWEQYYARRLVERFAA